MQTDYLNNLSDKNFNKLITNNKPVLSPQASYKNIETVKRSSIEFSEFKLLTENNLLEFQKAQEQKD